jgi:hypothetical protein
MAEQLGESAIALCAWVPEVVSFVDDYQLGTLIGLGVEGPPPQSLAGKKLHRWAMLLPKPEFQIGWFGLCDVCSWAARVRCTFNEVNEFTRPLPAESGGRDYEATHTFLQALLEKAQPNVGLTEPKRIGDDDPAMTVKYVAGSLECPFLVSGQGGCLERTVLNAVPVERGEMGGEDSPVQVRRRHDSPVRVTGATTRMSEPALAVRFLADGGHRDGRRV